MRLHDFQNTVRPVANHNLKVKASELKVQLPNDNSTEIFDCQYLFLARETAVAMMNDPSSRLKTLFYPMTQSYDEKRSELHFSLLSISQEKDWSVIFWIVCAQEKLTDAYARLQLLPTFELSVGGWIVKRRTYWWLSRLRQCRCVSTRARWRGHV